MGSTIYVVYQMGKVGSSTVYASLSQAGIEPLYKAHYVSEKAIADAQRAYANYPVRVPVPHEQESLMLREILERDQGAQPRWKIITLVREPIARDVSAYLEAIDLLHPELVTGPAPNIGRIARMAAAQFVGFNEAKSYTCQWFDEEIRDVFGIDVFAHPFDWSRGWMRLNLPRADVLVLRLEDLDRVLGPAMAGFTGLKVPVVYHSSRSAEKLQTVYRQAIYDQVVKRIRISEATCKSVYNSRYARHFYSDTELGSFARRWAGQLTRLDVEAN